MFNILVVDDSLAMRKNLKATIERIGHQVVGEAKSGEEAIALYEEIFPELITMDVTMPGIGGIEAVKRIVKKHPKARIIMVSAMSQKTMILEALEAGAINYIIKPIDSDILKDAITKAFLIKPLEHSPINANRTANRMDKGGALVDNLFKWELDETNQICKITIFNNINEASFIELNSKIVGIMFNKSLKVIFEFYHFSPMNLDILKQLIHLIKKLINAGVIVTIHTNREDISTILGNEGIYITK